MVAVCDARRVFDFWIAFTGQYGENAKEYFCDVMELSIILPCYNEEQNIAHSVRDTASWMDTRGMKGEIIVVDDGSKDASPALLETLAKEIPRLRVVRHEKNGGYGIAVRSGCDNARTEWIAFMDSDGQFHAEDLD